MLITDAGRRVLEHPPAIIDTKFLKQFPSFVELFGKSNKPDIDEAEEIPEVAYSYLENPVIFLLTKNLINI